MHFIKEEKRTRTERIIKIDYKIRNVLPRKQEQIAHKYMQRKGIE